MIDNYSMAGAQWGNLCAENKQNQQKRAPGGRATATITRPIYLGELYNCLRFNIEQCYI